MKIVDVIIIGGGAAGFFAAINIADQHPEFSITILEKGKQGLQKVKISGGGRCNVTHAEFVPAELVKNYPRGEKELLGPFHQFFTGDTMQWFESRGVPLKIEADGRIFPTSNESQSIIDCFLNQAKKHQIQIQYNTNVTHIQKQNSVWNIQTTAQDFWAKKVVLSTGSNPKVWQLLRKLKYHIIAPVPSLFTFNCKDSRIQNIPGITIPETTIQVKDTKLLATGPILITHTGFSGPAILKLSAFGAIILAKANYNFKIQINFTTVPYPKCLESLSAHKKKYAKKNITNSSIFNIPKRLWHHLVLASGIAATTRWAEITKKQIQNLACQLTQAEFTVQGKSTFKEEFVTAGGIDLKQVNCKTFESKLHKNLFFAGEILNIDAVTGGFNFQNAWTNAYIVSQNIGNNE